MADTIIVIVDEDLDDIVPIFLANRQKDIITIQDAVAKGDYETISILGHGMKGVGASYGFEPVTDLGIRLEQGAKEGDAAKISQAVSELAAYLARVEVRYE
ncbi:MAG: Hpt domain-containing protein [Proteobacteria bacterium]|nr:Hpt domain-containing protein [Pseudomonadota bacterium]MBU1649192.1 Hpt domain-containing protein [Pseudomonadota bacterium]